MTTHHIGIHPFTLTRSYAASELFVCDQREDRSNAASATLIFATALAVLRAFNLPTEPGNQGRYMRL
ncbi:MAG: hypothetical protein WBX22_30385 [Silvibacterium sp.]